MSGSGLFAQPAPQVAFESFPTDVLIGEDFKFRISFTNAGTAAGFGPIFDLVLPAGGADFNAPETCLTNNPPGRCDGITFVSAHLVEVVGGPLPLSTYNAKAPCNPGPAAVTLAHPFPGISPVNVLPGAQLVTIELPFGSFQPTQPKIVVEVTAHMDLYADPFDEVNALKMLTNCLRGVFRFGADELHNPTSDPPIYTDPATSPLVPPEQDSWKWQACTNARPTVFSMRKRYNGLENETATGPNHPKIYTITVDVAAGQTITDLTVKDFLPDNMAYVGLVLGLTTPGYDSGTLVEPVPNVPQLAPNNVLQLTYPTVVGGTGPEIRVTFEFFIPDLDANGNPILSPSHCTPAMATNDICGTGMWTPADCRDPDPSPVSFSTLPTVDHRLFAKCLAIQKGVLLASDPQNDGYTPGDTLEYTIAFQSSDYKTFGSIVVTDLLSDGQSYVPGSATVSLQDRNGSFDSAPMPASALLVQSACMVGTPPFRTTLTFDVSSAMQQLAPAGSGAFGNGILTGGKANTSTTIPALGTITFRTIIDDQFQCPVSPGNSNVDKHDPLNNRVTIQAEVLDNATLVPLGFQALDDSAVGFTISAGPMTKTIEAINGNPPTGPTPYAVTANDTITFRITRTIPSGDAERIVIEDFLPLPVLHVGSLSPALLPWSTVPPAGSISLGPLDNVSSAIAVPTVTLNVAANSVVFSYPAFQNAANTPYTIDLLISVRVSADPFADGLHLTNEAHEQEKNTFGASFAITAIAEFIVTEPSLRITKGIVASDNPKTIFSPVALGPLIFTAPGDASCERFSGSIINATTLPVLTRLNSDVSDADAGDRLTFVIVVQNLGSGLNGAYDIVLQEVLPECLINPGNICVTDGGGTTIPSTGNLFAGGLELIDGTTGALSAAHPTSGSDIAIITFDATYAPGVQPQCCTNQVALLNYSNLEGGTNFVAQPFVPPATDAARICSQPRPVRKCIVTTSEAHTTASTAAIGEIVRYRLLVQIPEGATSPGFSVRDSLPAGLAYLGNPTVLFVSDNGVSNSLGVPNLVGDEDTVEPNCNSPPLAFPFPAGQITVSPVGSGSQVVFNTLGFFNPDNDPNCEFLIIEFNALVSNVTGNQGGIARANRFGVFDGETQLGPLSASVNITVVEPNIRLTKLVTAKPQQVGDVVTYTVTFANQNTAFAATAFEVRLTDALPACLNQLNLVSVTDGTTPLVLAANNSGPTLLDITLASVPRNRSVVVTYTARLLCADCARTTNTVRGIWTTLPGPSGTCGNATGQCTPGASGAANGERNSSGGVNDNAASASAHLCSDLAVTKTAVGIFMAGLKGTYTITVTNKGSGPAVTPITVTDTVPSGLTPVSAAGLNWACTISGSTVTCTYTGPSIPPAGGFPPITLTVAIAASARGTTLLNCAQVQSSNDNNPANNQGCASVTVLTNPCVALSREAITCVTNGTYTYTFCVTNLFNGPVRYLTLLDPPPGVTFTPDVISLPAPIQVGQGACVTVTIHVAGDESTNLCFRLGLHSPDFIQCCVVPQCVTLPECCAYVANDSAVPIPGQPNCYDYTFSVRNLTPVPVQYLVLLPDPPNDCFSFSPNIVVLSTPLQQGQSVTNTVKLCVTAPCPTPFCFVLSIHDGSFNECCAVRHCLAQSSIHHRPVLFADGFDGSAFPAGTNITVSLIVDTFIVPLASVTVSAGTNIIGIIPTPSNGPVSVTWSNAVAGSYTLMAAAQDDLGGIWSSDPAKVFIGTGPFPPPTLLAPALADGNISFSMQTEAGVTCHVEYTESLASPNWTLLHSIVGDGSVMTVTDALTNAPQRFYRVRMQ